MRKFIFFISSLSLILVTFYILKKDNTANIQSLLVCITQIAPHPSLDKIRSGIEDEIKKIFGDKIKIEFQSAQGNISLASQIAQNFIGKNPAVIVAITTPSAQAVMATHTDIPLVFSGVTDPLEARLLNKDGSKKPNLIGTSDTPDITAQVNLLTQKLPPNATIGMIYNPGEVNSTIHIAKLETALADKSFKILKVTACTTSDVGQAVQSIIDKVDCFMLTNDNTIISSLDIILKTAQIHNIPIFCSDPESVTRGCQAAIATDQYEMGIETGKMVVRILQGENITNIPILNMPAKKFENSKIGKI